MPKGFIGNNMEDETLKLHKEIPRLKQELKHADYTIRELKTLSGRYPSDECLTEEEEKNGR